MNGRDGCLAHLDGIVLEIAQFLGYRYRDHCETQSPGNKRGSGCEPDLLNTPGIHKSHRSIRLG